jgi:hypothetical protein
VKINNLLRKVCDPLKRQMLIEFKILAFCFSNQVQRVADDNEEALYKVLSSVEINENGCAEASFINLKLIVNVFEISGEKQSKNTFIVHVVSIDEELEQKLQQQDIKAFLESGVEID